MLRDIVSMVATLCPRELQEPTRKEEHDEGLDLLTYMLKKKLNSPYTLNVMQRNACFSFSSSQLISHPSQQWGL